VSAKILLEHNTSVLVEGCLESKKSHGTLYLFHYPTLYMNSNCYLSYIVLVAADLTYGLNGLTHKTIKPLLAIA
jgi:hypothetical protein